MQLFRELLHQTANGKSQHLFKFSDSHRMHVPDAFNTIVSGVHVFCNIFNLRNRSRYIYMYCQQLLSQQQLRMPPRNEDHCAWLNTSLLPVANILIERFQNTFYLMEHCDKAVTTNFQKPVGNGMKKTYSAQHYPEICEHYVKKI